MELKSYIIRQYLKKEKMKKIISLIFVFTYFFYVNFNIQSEELKKELSLKDCINLALKNNLDIKIEELNVILERKDTEIEKSYFDKNLIFELNKGYSKKLSSLTLQNLIAEDTHRLNLSSGISQRLYSGISYNLEFNIQKQEGSLKSPQYQSEIILSLTHPLMQGSGVNINKTKLKIANIEVEIAHLKLKQKIIEIINSVEIAYYNFLFAEEYLKVKEKFLQSALDFEKEIKEKVKTGFLPHSDILQAQTKVAQREAELIEAKLNYQKAKDTLILLIFPEGECGDIDIVNFSEITYQEIDYNKEKQEAFLNRPDYNILKKTLQIENINLEFIKNQKLPNLDLVSNFGLQGLNGNFIDTFRDIKNVDYYNYQIGIQLKYPLGNRGAKEKYEREKIEIERLLLSLKNMEIKINKEIQDAIRDIEAAKEKLRAENKASELAFQNLLQEKEKFRLGLSTTFNVLQYEDEYNTAKIRELKAIIDYNVAVCNLYKVTGKNILRWRE